MNMLAQDLEDESEGEAILLFLLFLLTRICRIFYLSRGTISRGAVLGCWL
jgi:hypothetical protein